MRLMALDGLAEQAGLSEGQSLADARAMVPGLIAREIDHSFLAGFFGAFADWHANASPIVAILEDERAYGDLMLDITGVTHLFGGERTMLDKLTGRLEALGFTVQGAVAPTIGAAWALCHYAPGTVVGAQKSSDRFSPSSVALTGFAPPIAPLTRLAEGRRDVPPPPQGHPRDQGGGRALGRLLDLGAVPGPVQAGAEAGLADSLAPLPVSALRITALQSEGLRQMGLKTIGQLYGRERGGLQARFGVSLLNRLDQALGAAAERLAARLPATDYYAERTFAEPIGLIDDVTMTVKDLAHRLAGQLEADGLGAQDFHLMLFRLDHKLMHLQVRAGRASRDAGHIARLFANRIETLVADFDAGFGIEMIRLMATSLSGLEAVQTGVFALDDGAADLDRLYDRMASRLGPEAILRAKPVDSHIPERAVAFEPVVARTGDDAAAGFDPGRKRPLRLLPAPEEIVVVAEMPDGPPARMDWRRLSYRFVRASGPERIGVEWWQPGEGALSRDYYTAEDAEGRRFWLFREGLYATETATPRWFLHGVFA